MTRALSAARASPPADAGPQEGGNFLRIRFISAATSIPERHMVATITLTLSDDAYHACLRTLAAWWCLGSSAIGPQLLMQHAPLRRTDPPMADS